MSAADAPGFKAKGNEFFKAKDYPQAIEWYTKAVDADPANRVYYSNRAAAYTGKRHFSHHLVSSSTLCNQQWNPPVGTPVSPISGIGVGGLVAKCPLFFLFAFASLQIINIFLFSFFIS